MRRIVSRLLEIELPRGRSAFLWGPRRTGKTEWIRQNHSPHSASIIDLRQADLSAEYAARPELLRERWSGKLTIIDDVQKAPGLLDEAHWLIENRQASFLFTASSARKLRWGRANQLAAITRRFELGPLSCLEVEGFDLWRVLRSGLLPPHFLSDDPGRDLAAYIADYLREEIAPDVGAQNLAPFEEFLRLTALANGEPLDPTSVAREAGVTSKLARKFLEILEDTLLCFRLRPWTQAKRHRLVPNDKLYYFDVGISNHLAGRRPVAGGGAFARSFEHYLLLEIMNYRRYRMPDLMVRYWRTAGGLEAQFILGEMEAAIRVQAGASVQEADLGALRTIAEEHRPRRLIVESGEHEPREIAGIQILPWRVFIERLYAGELLS